MFEGARLIQVIETKLFRKGDGKTDPIRIITQYWTTEGELLAEVDPIKERVLEDPRTLDDYQ